MLYIRVLQILVISIHGSFQMIEGNTKMTVTLKEDEIGDTNWSCEFFLCPLLKYYDTILSIFQDSQYFCKRIFTINIDDIFHERQYLEP